MMLENLWFKSGYSNSLTDTMENKHAEAQNTCSKEETISA